MATGSSLGQVLSEARILVTKMHDREKLADHMITDAQTLNEKISCMKEYKEDMHELNDVCHTRPRSALVHSLQQENRQIRQLQDENRQLKTALEDHQTALELIMQRHRKLMIRIMQLSKKQAFAEQVLSHLQQGESQAIQLSQVRDFAGVFDSCLRLGEEASHRDQQEIAQLRTENCVLRQLMKIGASNNPLLGKQFNEFMKQQQIKEDRPSTMSDSVIETKKSDEIENNQTVAEIVDTPPVVTPNPVVSKVSESPSSNSVNSAEAKVLPKEKEKKPKTVVNGNNNSIGSSPTTTTPKTIKRGSSINELKRATLSSPTNPKTTITKRKSVESKTDSRSPTGVKSPPSMQPKTVAKPTAIKS